MPDLDSARALALLVAVVTGCAGDSGADPAQATPGATLGAAPGPAQPVPTGAQPAAAGPVGPGPSVVATPGPGAPVLTPTGIPPGDPSTPANEPGVAPPAGGGMPGAVPGPAATAPNPLDPAPAGGGAGPTLPGQEDPPPSLMGDVALSTPSQAFEGQLEVSLSTTVADAEIRYTTDGTLPTASSTLFDGTPLQLSDTTQLRAQAFVAGAASGAVSTGLYIARTFDVTSNLPILILDGYGTGKPEDKEVYFDAAVMVFEPDAGTAALSVLPTLAVRAGYHIRGQSSANFPQAPYKVEFWDNADADADYPVMGMPAESDWALISPYYDRTLIRNPFVYDLGREMGMAAPRYAFAEVYINYEGGPLDPDDYQGVYWFTETLKNQKNRLDLKQLEETETQLPDISGGYIMKFDQAAAEEPIIECTGDDPLPGFGGFGGPMGGQQQGGTCFRDLEVVDPDPLNAEQEAWLASYIQSVHDGLHQEPMVDYTALIDVPTFIDYLIVSELTMDVDSYVRSCYYHKDRDGLLKAGPLWDYNFALGGVGAQDALPDPEVEDDTGWLFSGGRNVNNWYQRLTGDPQFMAQVRARFTELRQGLLSDAAVNARIDALTVPLTEAAVRDFERWPVGDIITSETGFTGGPTVATWEGQVQVMRDFLVARLAWIEANLP